MEITKETLQKEKKNRKKTQCVYISKEDVNEKKTLVPHAL